MTTPPPKGRFALNLAANVLNFGLTILVGLWFTPYLIRHLGIAAYGLVPLALTATAYLTLFTHALTSTTGRFVTISLERGHHTQANRFFNTAFWSTAAVVCLLAVPSVWLASYGSRLFEVPPGREGQFHALLYCTVATFFLTTLSSPFGIATFCRNRFELANGISIVATLLRVGVVVVLFRFLKPDVSHIGIGLVVAAIVSVVATFLVCRYLTPSLRLGLRHFDRSALNKMTSMGGWIAVNTVGALLYLNIDLIVANRVLGPEAGGQYGAVMLWSTMLRQFAVVVAGVFAPTIIALYARKQIDELVNYSRKAVKFVGILLGLPVALICGFAEPLLRLWLGPEFTPLAPLLTLMTVHLSLNLAVFPLFNIQVATNHVRTPGVLTCVLGVINLVLAIALAGPAGWGMYGIAAAGALMLTAKNMLFTPYHGAKILGIGRMSFYRELMPIVSVSLFFCGITWLLAKTFSLNNWLALMTAGSCIAVSYAALAYKFVLSAEEKTLAVQKFLPAAREPMAHGAV